MMQPWLVGWLVGWISRLSNRRTTIMCIEEFQMSQITLLSTTFSTKITKFIRFIKSHHHTQTSSQSHARRISMPHITCTKNNYATIKHMHKVQKCHATNMPHIKQRACKATCRVCRNSKKLMPRIIMPLKMPPIQRECKSCVEHCDPKSRSAQEH